MRSRGWIEAAGMMAWPCTASSFSQYFLSPLFSLRSAGSHLPPCTTTDSDGAGALPCFRGLCAGQAECKVVSTPLRLPRACDQRPLAGRRCWRTSAAICVSDRFLLLALAALAVPHRDSSELGHRRDRGKAGAGPRFLKSVAASWMLTIHLELPQDLHF